MTTLTPQAFAKRWGASALSERSSYQQHFLDLCEMLGAPKPAETDPTGEFYAFEKGVEKTGGGKGFADVWYKDRFAIEYKGKHKDLTAAYKQLLQYRESLENPPLLVVTGTDRFEVHTNFTGTVTGVHSFTNADLPEPENLRVLRAMFGDPYSLKPTRTVQSVTEEAAGKFARLADELRGRGVDPQEAAHFLNKLLFCLFVEDVGLLPENRRRHRTLRYRTPHRRPLHRELRHPTVGDLRPVHAASFDIGNSPNSRGAKPGADFSVRCARQQCNLSSPRPAPRFANCAANARPYRTGQIPCGLPRPLDRVDDVRP